MLYKKYHRSYVRQFKRGTNFAIGSGESYCTGKVINDPFYMFSSVYIVGDTKHLWILVLPGGKINKHLYVI